MAFTVKNFYPGDWIETFTIVELYDHKILADGTVLACFDIDSAEVALTREQSRLAKDFSKNVKNPDAAKAFQDGIDLIYKIEQERKSGGPPSMKASGVDTHNAQPSSPRPKPKQP